MTDDTPKVQPALTPEDWERVQKYGIDTMEAQAGPCSWWSGDDGFAPFIALANAALPDGHPAKITRETIRILREATAGFGGGDWDSEPDALALAEFLDALQAYLPPDTP